MRGVMRGGFSISSAISFLRWCRHARCVSYLRDAADQSVLRTQAQHTHLCEYGTDSLVLSEDFKDGLVGNTFELYCKRVPERSVITQLGGQLRIDVAAADHSHVDLCVGQLAGVKKKCGDGHGATRFGHCFRIRA